MIFRKCSHKHGEGIFNPDINQINAKFKNKSPLFRYLQYLYWAVLYTVLSFWDYYNLPSFLGEPFDFMF